MPLDLCNCTCGIQLSKRVEDVIGDLKTGCTPLTPTAEGGLWYRPEVPWWGLTRPRAGRFRPRTGVPLDVLMAGGVDKISEE